MEHEHNFKLKNQLVTAILTNDLAALKIALDTVCDTDCKRCRLNIFEKCSLRSFSDLEQHHFQALRQVIRKLKLPTIRQEQDQGNNVLDDQWGLMHLAVALRRVHMVSPLMKTGCRGSLSMLIILIDTCYKNTALEMAVQRDDVPTLKKMLRVLSTSLDGDHADMFSFLKRQALNKFACRLCLTGRLTESLKVLLGACGGQTCVTNARQQHHALIWHVFFRDLCKIKAVESEYKPHPDMFHYAVCLYSKTHLGEKEFQILNHLLRTVNPNALCSLYVEGNREISGTAAHFTVSGYRPPLVDLSTDDPQAALVSIPTVQESDRGPRDNILQQRLHQQQSIGVGPRGVGPLMQMIVYLVHKGVDLSRPNRFQKTPLDCLSNDADSCLMELLITLSS